MILALVGASLGSHTFAMAKEGATSGATSVQGDQAQSSSVLSAGVEDSTPPSMPPNVFWGLDRIDQRSLPTDGKYRRKERPGFGAHVYVIDSGINPNDPDLTARLLLGPNEVSTETPPRSDSSECPSANHGTPVAGLIGGDTMGVAKEAVLVSVRAFDCLREGQADDIVSAFQWVIQNAQKPAVVSFSLKCTNQSCPADDLQDIIDAEGRTIAAGIPVVTGAGDQGIDACTTPVWAPGTIVVGALASDDEVLAQSNSGTCVNIWAPGDRLISGTIDPNGNRSFTGTAYAAALVTGEVADLLTDVKYASVPAAQIAAHVAAELDSNATLGSTLGPVGSAPSKLLFVPPAREGSSIAVAKSSTGTLQALGTDVSGDMFINAQSVPNGTGWNGWTQFHDAEWLSTAAGALADGRMHLLGLTANTHELWQRRQLTLGSPGLTGFSQIPGHFLSVAVAREADGLEQLIGVDEDGVVQHAGQTAQNATTYTPWLPFTGLDGAHLPAFASVAAKADSNGIVHVFAVDTHGRIWMSRQAVANSGWFSLVPFAVEKPHDQMANELLATEIAVTRDSTGRLDVIAASPHGLLHNLQTSPGISTWTGGWRSLSSVAQNVQHLAAETMDNGAIAVLWVDINGSVSQVNQSAPGSEFWGDRFSIPGRDLRP
ncbi:S8 family serine peptidase [Kribbella sp. NBC_00359]|uniref:S8 family serine peptidase n=1 Tax=Kribbella sp. NBC_00359 TaxID=2975966 RepID=UPI002E1B35D9